MNKRDLVLQVVNGSGAQTYIPAGFFLHFPSEFHRAPAGVDKHLEFFRYTGMDFVKIQYELPFPRLDAIQRPADWARIPFQDKSFFEPQLKVVEGLVKAAKPEALVVVTLYSPFMCAGQAVGAERRDQHIQEDPELVKKGMDIVTDSLMGFVQECIRIGVDGFYASTQGAEAERFADRALFDQCVRPYDLRIMDAINRACSFNILHVCDYHYAYADLQPFVDYPGQVVNTSLHLTDRGLTARQVSSLFGRPFMGGLERKGIIATGTPAQIEQAVQAALRDIPDRFILAADCTVPGETPWDNLRAAISAAHRWQPA